VTTTAELARIVSEAQGLAALRHAIHPATRTFQALRIHVNDELGELERGLDAALKILAPHGRLAVVSFHSLEDRIVKQFLARNSDTRPRASRHAPDAGESARAQFRLLTNRPRTPSEGEIAINPRARSAKLRVAERLAA
jgi:16S rRNA (cytosine1402-N4)-methyltransferase